MRDDIEQARRAGYSDEQILSVLADQNPEVRSAVEAGYKPDQIVSVVQDAASQAKRDAIKNQSWSSYAADLGRAVVYGAGQDAQHIGTTLAKPADATHPNSTMNDAGDALKSAGSLATGMAAGYQPAQFDVMHPIDTASELPKAAAEAAPGILAAVGAGALGGAVAGPIGATVGGLGGAAAYGLMKYWGGNAQAKAQADGRAQPTQADFDATLVPSLAQAGVDAASMKAGGMLGKGIGPAVGRAVGKPVGTLVGGGAEAAAMGAGGGINNAISQYTEDGKINLKEVADAAATGAGVRGVIGAVRAPGEIAGDIKYRTGGAINEAAVTRVIDHMSSDAFPGTLTKRSDTNTNIKLMQGRLNEGLSAISKSANEVGMTTEGKLAFDDAARFIKSGAVFDQKQLSRLERQVDHPVAFEALADANAANWMSRKAGTDAGRTLLERVVGTALKNPGKAGGVGAAISEGLPLLTGGLNVMTGGKIAGTALAAKALSKVTGLDAVANAPLEQIQRRFGSGYDPADPRGQLPSGPRTIEDFAGLNRAAEEVGVKRGSAPFDINDPASIQRFVATQEALNPGSTQPGGRPATPPPSRPATNPLPPELLNRTPPAAEPPHTSLAEALGAPEPRFQARPAAQTANRGPMMPDTGISPRPTMSHSDILTEMKIQAQAENQPLLDVAHLHHRSSRSIADNPLASAAERAQAKAQASDIWHQIIKPLEADASPAEIQRARSAKTVDAGPAPAPTLSPEGVAMLQTVIPELTAAIQAAPTQGAATRAVEAAVGKFKGTDKALVRDALAKHPEIVKATSLSTLKRTASGSKAIKAARKSAAKITGPGKGGRKKK